MKRWVFLGDSHFRGRSGYDIVSDLKERLSPGWDLVNAGVNADLAWNALQRLDSVIVLDPDRVTLLLGTNDINAGLQPDSIDGYRRDKGIDFSPTVETFSAHMSHLLSRLRKETDAQIQLIEIPPLEVDHSDTQSPLIAYHAAQQALAERFDCLYVRVEWGQVRCAPAAVNEAQKLHDEEGWDWDRIRDHFGFGITVDGLHLSKTSGKLLCSSILSQFPP